MTGLKVTLWAVSNLCSCQSVWHGCSGTILQLIIQLSLMCQDALLLFSLLGTSNFLTLIPSWLCFWRWSAVRNKYFMQACMTLSSTFLDIKHIEQNISQPEILTFTEMVQKGIVYSEGDISELTKSTPVDIRNGICHQTSEISSVQIPDLSLMYWYTEFLISTKRNDLCPAVHCIQQ